jgi:wyosine [tRNA(Phe)-imidazoG37] synthetase (radical SAM superfamily)
MNIIFGPVNSRRFGRSLGIDLSPNKKQCNFDCLYCELSPNKTVDKYSDIISVEDIMLSLKESLAKYKNIDAITITANGEPTLYPYLDELIDNINLIKGDIQTLILTNSSTISNKSIQQSLKKLDTVKLSLDCIDGKCLKKLDRAFKKITIDDIKKGLLEFKNIYGGNLVIEILLVETINDKKEHIKALNEFLLQLLPTRIDIGSVDRPPAYPISAINYDKLRDISLLFDSSLPIYIASRKDITATQSNYSNNEILATLFKRPLTDDDIEILFDDNSRNRLKILLKENKIKKISCNGVFFYKI